MDLRKNNTRLLQYLIVIVVINISISLISPSGVFAQWSPFSGGWSPWGYPSYVGLGYGYQQFYNPFGYQQQPYYPFGYQQQPYYPFGYQQQPYYPFGYQQQPYYPFGYQQFYNPYGYQMFEPYSFNTPFGLNQWPLASSSTCPPGSYAKPAIYLYPQEDTYIRVELDIDGQITQTIPSYDDSWYVLAKPDGALFDRRDGYDQDKSYDYLFWEAETDLSKLELPDQGWVVAKDNLESWFSANLPRLGLNEKEKAQFMEYWLEKLSESAYYELKLLSDEFLAEHATLIITPQPDTLIRVIFSFRPMDQLKTLGSPVIETPKREGFVVLEWGGILGE